ncbi:MAG TPA: sulfite exporter TauE/SafE family protein [Candidatus Ligilactobacillus excrementigallinarum]|uniref:Probable membrane transporter protein n=1 Tax=Candidatus Ligilactobacillus excrementigallinarum TaxID=2838641 RepID=A0A9D2AA43_9LACO|nr:sulfite exporter TauE/SafE family protein [Candidatus Ligilactobacillus excrementigallinarum]
MLSLLKLCLFLLIAGFLAGAMSSAAGLASLFSYPALLMAGLSPVIANVTNTYSLLASGFSSVAASRQELKGQKKKIIQILPLTIIGVIIGALLLFWVSASFFKAIVPFFIFTAAILMVIPFKKRNSSGNQSHAHHLFEYLGIFLVGVYAGYFGAGSGIVMLALLMMLFDDQNFAVNNALKNLTMVLTNIIGALIYLFEAPILWKYVIPMAIGFAFGGVVGPKIVRIVPEKIMRWVCFSFAMLLGFVLLFQNLGIIK